MWAYLLPAAGLAGVVVGLVRASRAQTKTQRAVGIGLAAVGGALLVLTYAGHYVNEVTILDK